MSASEPESSEPWLIIGQGLAGSCLAWNLDRLGLPFQLIDRGHSGSTRIAAGMVNPITGKNFEPSWKIGDFHSHAISFYRDIEEICGVELWHPLPVLRLAGSEKEWAKISSKLQDPAVIPWISHLSETPHGWIGAVVLNGGGRLDTKAFMKATADHFSNDGKFSISEYDIRDAHPKRILCQGADGLLDNQLGQHRCAKGEILTVRADWDETHIRIGAGGWIVPIGEQSFRLGSTYEWNELDETPTAAARDKLCLLAGKLGGPDFEIIDQVAGIRPILRRSQPVIGKNREGDWFFNALGSKGTLYAPLSASYLAKAISQGDPIPPELLFEPSST